MALVRDKRPVVAGVGLVTLDVIAHRACGVEPATCAGGTCGNVLAILSYFGWESYPIARLNASSVATRVKNDLRRWGVRLDFLSMTPSCDAPVVIQRITTDRTGRPVHRYSLTCPSCGNWLPGYRPVKLSAAETVATRLKQPDVFFLDRVAPGNLLLARKCAERGALVFFEPAGMGDVRLLNEALSLAHVVKYSAERIRALPRRSNVLIEIQTRGQEGLRYRVRLPRWRDTDWCSERAFPVAQFMDAGGSGDWTSAGLIDRLGRNGASGLRVASPTMVRAAFQSAQAFAAWNCSFFGARGGMYHASADEARAAVNRILRNQSLEFRKPADGPLKATLNYHCPACRRGRNATMA